MRQHVFNFIFEPSSVIITIAADHSFQCINYKAISSLSLGNAARFDVERDLTRNLEAREETNKQENEMPEKQTKNMNGDDDLFFVDCLVASAVASSSHRSC